ncbi:hypothetical protein M2189_001697 [Bradyrhizobium japonicum]|uniref:baseplate J/gp47 family protein n=1 Tax=Bradyrhizobium japonicum TaxID=375 RepID=UPI00216AABFC|nr:baseplate J/gp47 family protein [Bradyrhizobium japonicum]MCS3499342.1 hypothetical protein [Bradyrhizobium japonicum]MCS3958494.1 hypothetical protein [Bradyrhizobium japonicum]MCS4000248.1 hypothetical protein [Bradyrhizobium japonicum]
MLIELMAWVADQQIYALGRQRRDERYGYAALLGLKPHAPRPAGGLLWLAGNQPLAQGGVLPKGAAAVSTSRPESPEFIVAHDVHLTRASIAGMQTVLPDGNAVTLAADAGTPGRPVFAPFGEAAAPGTRLDIQLTGELLDQTPTGSPSPLSIGISCANDNSSTADDAQHVAPGLGLLRARMTWDGGAGEMQLRVLDDQTDGFLRSGVVLIDIGPLAGVTPGTGLTLQLSLNADLPLTPRLAALALNVVPVQQQTQKDIPQGDVWIGNGLPGQVFQLESETVPFELLNDDLQVIVGGETWEQREDFRSAGPADRVFLFDRASRTVRFGNGLNGKVPAAGSNIAVDCQVCAGAAGNLPAKASWQIKGANRSFTNIEPMRGGADRADLAALRRDSRRRVGTTRPLVTDADLVEAALACRDLNVARAEILSAFDADCRAGSAARGRTLIAICGDRRADPAAVPESPTWLQALRRRLLPRVPLGDRVKIEAPRYVLIRLNAKLKVAQNCDAAAIKTRARRLLGARFAIAKTCPVDTPWPLGRDVRASDVAGWLIKLPGVTGVSSLLVGEGQGPLGDAVKLPRDGLPQLHLGSDDVAIEPTARGTRS